MMLGSPICYLSSPIYCIRYFSYSGSCISKFLPITFCLESPQFVRIQIHRQFFGYGVFIVISVRDWVSRAKLKVRVTINNF